MACRVLPVCSLCLPNQDYPFIYIGILCFTNRSARKLALIACVNTVKFCTCCIHFIYKDHHLPMPDKSFLVRISILTYDMGFVFAQTRSYQSIPSLNHNTIQTVDHWVVHTCIHSFNTGTRPICFTAFVMIKNLSQLEASLCCVLPWQCSQ